VVHWKLSFAMDLRFSVKYVYKRCMKQATDNNEKLSSICGDETIGKKVVFDAVGVFVEEVFMLMK